MIQVTPQMRVLVATAAVDFRNGIDGLAQLCRAEFAASVRMNLPLPTLPPASVTAPRSTSK